MHGMRSKFGGRLRGGADRVGSYKLAGGDYVAESLSGIEAKVPLAITDAPPLEVLEAALLKGCLAAKVEIEAVRDDLVIPGEPMEKPRVKSWEEKISESRLGDNRPRGRFHSI